MMKFAIFICLISQLALGDHDEGSTPGGAQSLEAAKISLANVAREVQRAGVKRVYFDVVPGDPTVERYKKREKILRGVLKLAKSKNLDDLLIDGIEFQDGGALTGPKPG